MIYLDYNATTPVHPDVLKEMIPYFLEKFANAASRTHVEGREVGKIVLDCRHKLADIFGIDPQYIIFTSGATEANNLVLLGISKYLKSVGKTKIITSEFEHKSILDPLSYLENEHGFEVVYVSPNRLGHVSLVDFEKNLDEKTGMVTLMHVNNELGTVQPILEVAEAAKRCGALVHVDGAQGFCKVSLDLYKVIDYYTASAHKIYGPKGIGCLFINGRKARKPLRPIVFGGGHEAGLRPGTLPVPLIVGFAKASEICRKLHSKSSKKKLVSSLEFIKDKLEQYSSVNLNSDIDPEVGTTLNFRVSNIKSEALFLRLKDIGLSNGSACTSADYRPSHVLKSIGLTDEESLSSIRLSIGYRTTKDELSKTIDGIGELIQ